MRKIKRLEDVFPVWKIEQLGDTSCILDKLGNVTVAYELHLPEIFTSSTEEFVAMHSAWVRAIRVLPYGSILHRQDWFTQNCYIPEAGIEPAMLDRAAARHFNERPYRNHQSYVFFTMLSNGKATGTLGASALMRGSLVNARSLDTAQLQDFIDRASQCMNIVKKTGRIGFSKMGMHDVASDEKAVGLIEKYCTLRADSEARLTCDILMDHHLQVGEKKVEIYTLCDADTLPTACGPRLNYDRYSTDTTAFPIGFSSPIGLMLDCDHIVNQYLVIGDPSEAKRLQEKRRLRLQSLSAYSRENAISRDSVNQYLNEAVAHGRQPVRAHINLVCFAEQEAQLREIKNKASAALSQMDAGTKIETDAAAQLFWAGIPGNAAGIPLEECFDTFTEQASSFFIAETNYADSRNATGIRFCDRLYGRPLHVDLSDEPMKRGVINNRSKVIIGPSGSGKSVCCNHMIRSYVEQGAHALIVDVGGSYEGLCELLGGYYFTYTETKPISFNPFWFEGEADTEKKESIKTLLLSLWKKDSEEFSRSEYVAISNAVQGYFDSNKSFPCFNGFYEYLQTEYADLMDKQKIREKDFDLSGLLYVLRPYFRGGEFDFLLNATENLDLLNKQMIVFELDNIKNHQVLFPAVTLTIMDNFLGKMRKLKGVRKIMLIEEAWKAIAKQGMAEYIKYLFKTVRKFYGEAWVVTQDIDDIVGSAIIKDAIINNADCKILLDQSKYVNKFSQLQEILGLTEKEKALVLSVNKANDPSLKYKEVFVSLGGTEANVYRLELSTEEYLAYTTEEKEKMKVREYAQRFGSIREGIRQLAAELREESIIG